MRLSLETYTTDLYFGHKDGLKMIKDAGFDCVDFSYYFETFGTLSPDGNMLDDRYMERAKETRKLLDDIGLSCNQAHAPFSFAYANRFTTDDYKFNEVVRAIRSAAILGASHIVVHSIKTPEGPFSQEGEDRNFAYFKALEPYAEDAGIQIAVENLISAGCTVPGLHNRMMERLDSDNFVALVDLGHANLAKIKPENYLREMKPGLVKGLHVQDNHGQTDEHINPFMGNINWPEVMKALKETGYEGDCTLEVLRFLQMYSPALHFDALKLSAATGRHLIRLFEEA